MNRLLAACLLLTPASGWAQIIAVPRAPDTGSYSPATDVAAVAELFQGRAPLAYEVVKSYPHDTGAFTEGLLWYDGTLFESTGLKGQSDVRRVDLASGAVLKSAALPNQAFAEGLARVGDALVQITYKEGRAFVYDAATLQKTGDFRYFGEGWGLTYDGQSLIMSDGSSTLTFRDPATFQARRRVSVTVGGKPLGAINEMEFIDGKIWANIWLTDIIAIIDPATGEVTAHLDLSGLVPPDARSSDDNDVLNGIAYDPAGGRVFVTGKRWPRLYELKVARPR